MTLVGTELDHQASIQPVENAPRSTGRFTRKRIILVAALAPVIVFYLVSLFVPLPYSPTQPDTTAISLAPSAVHLFGTDASGFDVLSRTIASARLDLPLAIGGTLIAFVIGVPIGLLVSSEGWMSNSVMRGVDALQALPLLIISVAVVTLAGNNIADVIFAIVLVGTPAFIRLVRSGALVVRKSRYVDAAITVGCSPFRVLRVHVFPNVLPLVLVQCSIGVAQAIIVIGALNFLGVGVSPPTPSWGSMISTGAGVIGEGYWWVAFFPALAILLMVVCLNTAARAVDEGGDGQ